MLRNISMILIGIFIKHAGILWVFYLVYLVSSWSVNVYKLTELNFESPYKAEVIRSISVVSPLFLVTGFMDIGEENE